MRLVLLTVWQAEDGGFSDCSAALPEIAHQEEKKGEDGMWETTLGSSKGCSLPFTSLALQSGSVMYFDLEQNI